jgi:hypothetical protein
MPIPARTSLRGKVTRTQLPRTVSAGMSPAQGKPAIESQRGSACAQRSHADGHGDLGGGERVN